MEEILIKSRINIKGIPRHPWLVLENDQYHNETKVFSLHACDMSGVPHALSCNSSSGTSHEALRLRQIMITRAPCLPIFGVAISSTLLLLVTKNPGVLLIQIHDIFASLDRTSDLLI
jgi:hypothetical protein